MKRIFAITGFSLMLAATIFLGCSKSEDVKSEDVNVPIKVNTEIHTRASMSQWNDNDSIAITMFQQGTFTPAIGSFINKKYVTTVSAGGSFTAYDANSIIYFPKDGSLVDFMSYYPYSSQMTSDYIIPLDVSDQSVLPKIDFMTAQHLSGNSKDNPNVKLRFSHRLSLIVVNLQVPTGDNPQRLIGSQVTVQGMLTKGSYKLNNNTNGVDLVNTSMANLALNTNSAGTSAAGIVFPRTSGSGIIFQIALLDGGRYTAYMDSGLTLMPGYQYTFTITLQKTPIVVYADIVEWITGPNSVINAY